MASPLRPERFPITPTSAKASRLVFNNPLTDEAIWKRLKDAGFDEESIKRKDKAALIGYVTKLEAEIFDHQHHMGLLLLERKEWASKYEQLKASAESAEHVQRREQASHLAALAQSKKREDNLKKALEIEKECIANIEKTMHELRAESAEVKIAAKITLDEARAMMEEAQKKLTEAEAKLLAAESLQAETNHSHHIEERKLHDIEAREDDLKRRIISFKSECEAKENQINLEKQALCERQKTLEQGQERLLDGQALLNQREDHIFNRTQDLHRLEKELDASKIDLEDKLRALNEEKANLNLSLASLSAKEEDIIRKEVMLNKKEQELLVLQEKLASKETAEIKKLSVDHECALKKRVLDVEAELEVKRKLAEDDIDAKRRAWELKEVDLHHREELIQEREHDVEVYSRALTDKENGMIDKMKSIDAREKNINQAEEEVELKKMILQKEQEEINRVKLDLENSLNLLEDKTKQVDCAKENVDAMKSETNELLILETKLKEEIDIVRAEKQQLMALADELKVEKAKFEAEWESIDEKREELRKEAERAALERQAIFTSFKDERDSLKMERDLIQEQYKKDLESLNRDREQFMNKIAHERTGLLKKVEKERSELLLEIEAHKKELESCIAQRREELERDFREREKSFEQEKVKELEYINSLKENVAKDSEYVASEMRRLETERVEIKVDRERRDREWREINHSIEELKLQMEKLKQQRELLHADREDIHTQVEHLKNLELMHNNSIDNAVMRKPELEYSIENVSHNILQNQQKTLQNSDVGLYEKTNNVEHGNEVDTEIPSPAPLSWIKRCAGLIFKQSPEKSLGKFEVLSDKKETSLKLARQIDFSNGYDGKASNGNSKSLSRESKGILELLPSSNNVSESSTGQGILAGRKRRNMHSSSNNLIDSGTENYSAKKMKQHEDTAANLSEETLTRCLISMQENELGTVTINPNNGVSEQEKRVISDKIIQVSEVGCDNPEIKKAVTPQYELDCVQSSIAELVHDGLLGGATEGPSTSQEMGLEVPLVVDYQFTELIESAQEEGIPPYEPEGLKIKV